MATRVLPLYVLEARPPEPHPRLVGVTLWLRPAEWDLLSAYADKQESNVAAVSHDLLRQALRACDPGQGGVL